MKLSQFSFRYVIIKPEDPTTQQGMITEVSFNHPFIIHGCTFSNGNCVPIGTPYNANNQGVYMQRDGHAVPSPKLYLSQAYFATTANLLADCDVTSLVFPPGVYQLRTNIQAYGFDLTVTFFELTV